jgi:hypothetical protein
VIARKYWEMWKLQIPKGNIRIVLKADAIEPSFTVAPRRKCYLSTLPMLFIIHHDFMYAYLVFPSFSVGARGY